MNFKNNILPLGRRGTDFCWLMTKEVCKGVKIQFGHLQSLSKIHCSAYGLDTNPLRLVGFTTEMFWMKINQKLYTQSSNFTFSRLMKFKLCLHLDAAILFWRKCASCICDGKNAAKLAQIVASLIQGREHKGKWTSFHLLPDSCPLCFSCYVK